MIADEVVSAFGRLGDWFGTSVMGMKPDLITVAKGITSGYVPLSACMVTSKVWDVLVEGSEGTAFGHGYTYSSHPLAAAAALANLDIVEDRSLIANVKERGERLQKRLREAFDGHPMVGEVRGRDLIAAVEFVESTDPPKRFDPSLGVGKKITKACLDRGVITRALPEADTISFSPPFVVEEAEIDRMAEVARDAADEVMASLELRGN